jgi:chromosome segregation ATPase
MIAPVNVPTSSRLQRTEAALAAETTAREKAERSLNEAYAVVKDLQTKIGHAELAKNEAIEALRRERETIAQLRAELHAWDARLQEAHQQLQAAEAAAQAYQDQLSEERQARKAAEKALAAAEAARDAAEQVVRTLSEETNKRAPAPSSRAARRSAEQQRTEAVSEEPKRAEPAQRSRRTSNATAAETKPRRGRVTESAAVEPEPVKWWLNTKPASKRR